jgi:hypothetical protein
MLVTLMLAPQIVQYRQRSVRRTSVEATTLEAPPLKHSLHQLRITEQLRGADSFFDCELYSPDLGLLERDKTEIFTGDRQQYVDNLYREIENYWLGSDEEVLMF